jgi:hypothetical protein
MMTALHMATRAARRELGAKRVQIAREGPVILPHRARAKNQLEEKSLGKPHENMRTTIEYWQTALADVICK